MVRPTRSPILAHPALIEEYQPNSASNLKVETLEEGGYAQRAGLQPGDFLLALAGVPVFTRPELWVMLRQHEPGEKLEVEYGRNGERGGASAVL